MVLPRFHTGAVLVLALSVVVWTPVQAPLAGTYELLICRSGCGLRDRSRAYVRGTLVITAHPVPFDSFPELGRRRLLRSYMFYGPPLLRGGHSDGIPNPNGCFVLTSVAVRQDSYVGIERVGALLWQFDSAGGIYFPLYRSPDAGYGVTLHVTGDVLNGSGVSWGAGVTAIHSPPDSIIAWRIGPPALARCSVAIVAGTHDSA